MEWFRPIRSWRRTQAITVGVLGALALIGAVALHVAGFTSALPAFLPLTLGLAPVVITAIVIAPRLDREQQALIARGMSLADAGKRVWRTSAVITGPALVCTGAWCWLVGAITAAAIPAPPGLSPRFLATLWAWQFFAGGAIACCIIWRTGRIIGEGPHCRRCGYAASGKFGVPCAECGRIFTHPSDITDGRIDRPAWIPPFAIAAILLSLLIMTLGMWRPVRVLATGLLPTSMLLSGAVSADSAVASNAWNEIWSRELSDTQRAQLLNQILTILETNGALPPLHAKKMAGFMHDELIRGAMSPHALDRLIALRPVLAADLYGRQLLPPLRQASLTPAQADALATNALAANSLDSDADWLAAMYARGELSAAQRKQFVALLEANLTATDPLALGKAMTAERLVASVIAATRDNAIRGDMLALLLARIKSEETTTAAWRNRDLLNRAFTNGWLADADADALMRRRNMSHIVPTDQALHGMRPARRAHVIALLLTIAREDSTRFARDNYMQWAWLRREYATGRLTEEESRAFMECLRAIRPERTQDPSP